MFGSKEEIIHALNIVVGHHPKAASSMVTVAANRHFNLSSSAQDRLCLGAGLQVIRGFFMSVRAATARILVNVQVKNMAFFDDGPLDRLMQAFVSHNGTNKVNLLKFVKKLSVDVMHIVRRNRQGQRIPRIKRVEGFATRDDGRNLTYPPIVPRFGAGANEVHFFLDDSSGGSPSISVLGAGGGGKKGEKPPNAGPKPPLQGSYISVFDFFQQSKLSSSSQCVGNTEICSIKHYEPGSYVASNKCRDKRQSFISTVSSLRGQTWASRTYKVEPRADPADDSVCCAESYPQRSLNRYIRQPLAGI